MKPAQQVRETWIEWLAAHARRPWSLLATYWLPFLAFYLICLVTVGWLGRYYGVPQLFRPDPMLRGVLNDPRLWGCASAAVLLLFTLIGASAVEKLHSPAQNLPPPRRLPVGSFLVTHLALLGVAVTAPDLLAGDWTTAAVALAVGAAGVAIGVGLTLAFFSFIVALNGLRSEVMRRLSGPAAVVALLLLLAAVAAYGQAAVGTGWSVIAVALLFATLVPESLQRSIGRRLAPAQAAAKDVRFFWLFFWATVLAIALIVTAEVIVPAVGIVTLLLCVNLIILLILHLRRHYRVLAGLMLAALIVAHTDDVGYLQFPGFVVEQPGQGGAALKNFYAPGQRVSLAEKQQQRGLPVALDGDESRQLIGARRSLEAWSGRRADDAPKVLVVISAQGGAYRAGFWTAKVVDLLRQLESRGALAGFTGNVRLLTGASGGMVPLAYYAAEPQAAATLETRLRLDTYASREKGIEINGSAGVFATAYPYDRDGLTAAAQQMVQRDVPRYLLSPLDQLLDWRWEAWGDRGSVLEQQWRALRVPFSALYEQERQGLRPSLIISPMLIETGQVLFISNLALHELQAPTQEVLEKRAEYASKMSSAEAPLDDGPGCAALSTTTAVTPANEPYPYWSFFELFPETHSTFLLQTAVRMNASFPYVSPAVELPTEPPMRVVDAGYYDNYGVSTAVAWLSQPCVVHWLNQNYYRVLLVEVRAFGNKSEGESATAGGSSTDQAPSWLQASLGSVAASFSRSTQWATSPISGAGSARASSMVFRNNNAVRQLRFVLGDALDHVAFTNALTGDEATMSWYVLADELDRMDDELCEQHNLAATQSLLGVWSGGVGPAAAWGVEQCRDYTQQSDPCAERPGDDRPVFCGGS